MSDVRLVSLDIKNFKGVSEFTLNLNGDGVSIYGDNATGKTTLMDAFMWLLFGKDSLNKTDFPIKHMDHDGEPAHYLEHSVSATFDIDGNNKTFRKVFSEKWTKKRGSATKEFIGHTINHFVDGVPCSERQFKSSVELMADEITFRLLTNPRHFSEYLKWQDRRNILTDICGDITDDDVIASSKDLAALPEILNGRSLDDHRKVLASRKSEINRELDQIPARIQENQRAITGNDTSEDTLAERIRGLEAEKIAAETAISTLEAGGGIAKLTVKLQGIHGELFSMDAEATRATHERLSDLQLKVDGERALIAGIEKAIYYTEQHIRLNESKLARYKQDIKDLRAQWHTVNDETFPDNSTCPTCGQDFPEEKIAEYRGNFNADKAKRLEAIKRDGKMNAEFVKRLSVENEKYSQDIDTKQRERSEAHERLDKFTSAIHEPTAFKKNPDRDKLIAELDSVRSEIETIKSNRSGAVDQARAEVERITTEIKTANAAMAQVKNNIKAVARIDELKAQERDLSAEFEKAEYELHLCDLFIRRKVSMLTDRINSRFKITRFKLFNEQINGGIEPCCEVMVNGVPYSGLNNSMRIKSGLDIINTLCDAHQLTLPVWVDNAESTTEFPEMKSQLIRLYVSKPDKTLRIEKEKENGREAA